MRDRIPSRRALLKAGGALGTVAALAVPVAVLPKAEAAPADPVFAAITRHAAARLRLNELDGGDAGWEKAADDEDDLWQAFYRCRPRSLDGLAAYVAHAAAYPDLWALQAEDGPAQVITNVAGALRSLNRGAAA